MLFDAALMTIKERFEQLYQHAETWGLLYEISELPTKIEFIKHCSYLKLALTVVLDADIAGAPLCVELLSIRSFVKKLKNNTALNILNFMKKFIMEDLTTVYGFL
jgi:hypothetical protein